MHKSLDVNEYLVKTNNIPSLVYSLEGPYLLADYESTVSAPFLGGDQSCASVVAGRYYIHGSVLAPHSTGSDPTWGIRIHITPVAQAQEYEYA